MTLSQDTLLLILLNSILKYITLFELKAFLDKKIF